ncbi:hypothetical protein R4611_16320 [Acinetobacter baumannii]|nr:hypothetical protein [Acinetobacter baumannii]
MDNQQKRNNFIERIKSISHKLAEDKKMFTEVNKTLEKNLKSHFDHSNEQYDFHHSLSGISRDIIIKFQKTSDEFNFLIRLIEDSTLNTLNNIDLDLFNYFANVTNEFIIKLDSACLSFINTADTIHGKILEEDGSTAEASQSASYVNMIVRDILIIAETIPNILEDIYDSAKKISEIFERNINFDIRKIEMNFQNILKEEISIITKKFNVETENLTKKFENQIKNYELDLNKLRNSSELLITGVDAGLKNLNELTDKSQNLELYFSTVISDKKNKIDEELNNKILDIDNQFNAVRSRLNTKTEKIKNSQKDLMKLLEKTSIHKLTENYEIKAGKEEKAYKINSRITIGAIIAAIITTIIIIGLPIYEYWKHVPPVEPNFYTIVARLTVSLMFFVLAIYTSKQAAKHYECFQENYRTYLQLAALEPFMSRMSEEEQKDIRKGLIPTYFNQNADGKFASKGDEVTLPADLKGFAEKLIDVGKGLLDKAKDEPKP